MPTNSECALFEFETGPGKDGKDSGYVTLMDLFFNQDFFFIRISWEAGGYIL